KERHALQRQASSPVRDCGQQETGHDRGDIAKKKFMGVPGNRAVAVRKRPPTGEQPDPKHHSDGGPQCGAEEKWPETVAQSWHGLRPEPRNAAGPGTAGLVHPTSPVRSRRRLMAHA